MFNRLDKGMKDPFFSIIIPTYNREAQIRECLSSLVNLDYPRARFEVVIVDDGSSSPLTALVEPFRNELEVNLLRQENSGPAAARNRGAAAAKGEFLAFTDDDCRPAPGWLKTLAARFRESPEWAVGGKTVNSLKGNSYSETSQLLIDYLYSYYNRNPGDVVFIASNNLALPADRYSAIGGFDTSFPNAAAEDRDFCERWRFEGNRIQYAPEVLVNHHHVLTFTAFWKQHYNYGKGAWQYHRRRSERNRSELKLEPVSFYFKLFGYPFQKARGWTSLRLAFLLFLSQCANGAGFILKRISGTGNRDKGESPPNQ